MCLYPRLIKNKKYLPNKKNNGNPPTCEDERLLYVPVGCGNCIECRKQKQRNWLTRLNQEYKESTKAYYITLTFSEESLNNIETKIKYSESNAVAGYAVRHFLERWRKEHKKSVKHWLITELGHEDTQRIHLHGIIFTNETLNNDKLQRIWQYGFTNIGKYCNIRTINYIVKYITKTDNDHKGYMPQIFCSAGIGRNWTTTAEFNNRRYKGTNTIEYMTLESGARMNLPIYYRNKLYTETEKEMLWLQKLDAQRTWVCGIEVPLKTDADIETYNQILEAKRKDNIALGYGDNSDIWKKKQYNTTLKRINLRDRYYKRNEKCDKS